MQCGATKVNCINVTYTHAVRELSLGQLTLHAYSEGQVVGRRAVRAGPSV